MTGWRNDPEIKKFVEDILSRINSPETSPMMPDAWY